MISESKKNMHDTVNVDMARRGEPMKPFKLVWNNLSMTLTVEREKKASKSLWNLGTSGSSEKTILQPMSGTISSGTLTALMGPSGAGKSTLLNLITGKLQADHKTHIKGECFLSLSPFSSKNEHRISFVPQKETFFRSFTIRETLMFSCKLNNPDLTLSQHEEKMNDILDALDLKEYVNYPLSKLSGGQVKRLSIANEMISSPTILVLDEPSSGLDSDATEKLVKTLRKMSRSTVASPCTPAIIATIHSPSYEVFCAFDSIYMLNKFGANIYSGPPRNIAKYLSDVGFPEAHGNPADFAIEVANAKYGDRQFIRMQQLSLLSVKCPAQKPGDINMIKFKQEPRCSTMQQVMYLTSRSLVSSCFKSPQSVVIALMHLATGLFLVHLPQTPPGEDAICWEYSKPWDQIDRSNFTASDLIYEIKLQMNNESKLKNMSVVSNFVYFLTTYLMFIHAIIAAVLTPAEMPIVKRELTNNYYTVRSYFFSKLLGDLFIVFITILPASIYVYFISGQLIDSDNLWRLPLFVIILYNVSVTWHIAGLSIGLFVPDILVSTAVVVAFVLTNMFLSEFFMTVDLMSWYFSFLPSIMSIHAAFSLFLAILYGFDRCSTSGTLKTISVTGYDHPKDSFAKMWWFLNFEYEDMRRQASIYDLEVDYMYSFYDQTVKWLGPKRDVSHKTHNYMLDFFHISEDLTQPCTIAISWLLIAIGVFWYALSSRSKLTRL